MVAFAAALMSVTAAVLPVMSSHRSVAWVGAVVMLLVACVCALTSLWRRVPQAAVVYPLIVFGGIAIVGQHVTTFGQAYGGMFTIAFVYVGLFLPRIVTVFLVPLAAVCWWTSNGGFAHPPSLSLLGVRLAIAVTIWIGIAQLLAAYANTSQVEQRRLVSVANHDTLTGLRNRRSLPEIFAASRPGDALVLLDLDHFKTVNDNAGHAAGDATLIALGEMLRLELRRDDIAVRYGGEEVCIVLHRPELDQVPNLLSRLRSAWAASAPLTTYSSGTAYIADGETAESALRRADALLYRAKGLGRDRDVIEGVPPDPPSTPRQSPASEPTSRQAV